jgi:glutathione S-transferase
MNMESHMPHSLRLISHKLCPFVQRAVIVASEKEIPFERVNIDLSNKPDWFLAMSPTGKVPVLEVTDEDGTAHILFESGVIAEYLDEIAGKPLLPSAPLERARQRAWVEFASGTIGDIGKFYSAGDKPAFDEAAAALGKRFDQLEQQVTGPWFAGERFGLVDAAFAPAFRYLQVFKERADVDLLAGLPKVEAWSDRLLARGSVQWAVAEDYADELAAFTAARASHLGRLLIEPALAL